MTKIHESCKVKLKGIVSKPNGAVGSQHLQHGWGLENKKELKLQIYIQWHHICEILLTVSRGASSARISTFRRGFVSIKRKECSPPGRIKRIQEIERCEQGRVSQDAKSTPQHPTNLWKKGLIPDLLNSGPSWPGLRSSVLKSAEVFDGTFCSF